MKLLKQIAFILILSLCLGVFLGCETSVKKYNAVIYDDEGVYINETFKENNEVNYSYSDSESLPLERTFIVKTEEDFNEIFNVSTDNYEIDFQSQMLIVCTFSISYRKAVEIDNLTLENEILDIDFVLKSQQTFGKPDAPDMCSPYQRWIIVKLDKIDIENAEFEIDHRT